MGAHSTRRNTFLALTLVVLLTVPLASPVGTTGNPGVPDGTSTSEPGPASDHAETGVPPDGATDSSGASGALADPRDGRGSAGGPVEHDRRRVTLVTGETVTLTWRDGEPSIDAVEGGSVGMVATDERTYLLPHDVDLSTYDRSLFAVESLLAREADRDGFHVLLDGNTTPDAANAAGLRNAHYLRSADVIAAETDPSAPGAVADLVTAGHVERVSVDRAYGRLTEPAPTTAAVSTERRVTGEGVTVAVLDTGIDGTHPDLEGRVVDRFDLVDDGASADGEVESLDPHGHGTHVAGVLAGSGVADDGRAHAGVAPGADLLDVRVMNDHGVGRSSAIIGGIERAVEADADVVLLSIGTAVDGSDEIAESVEWATEQGVVVVAAAGNRGGPRSIGAPGRPADAITVGGIDDSGSVASYSSRGPTLDGRLKPDLVAPSGGIVGPRADGAGRVAVDDAGHYTRIGGTSVAAPQVAGAAALLLEDEPGLAAREIENRLASAARPIPDASTYAQGSGALDIDRTLDPDVVATDGVVDFGLVETDERRNRTITLVNRDDQHHDLSLESTVWNVDLDRRADGTAALNRTDLSLGPGERTSVSLSIDGNTTSGAHAGAIRYTVAGEPRSIAFGFMRGGNVTVEKRPLTAGDRVDGDELWVITEEGTHDELLEFENGTASFVAGGGTYVLWSTGYDEASGTTVFLSERQVVDGPTHVVLDEERDTVPVGVDVDTVEERYGRLVNRSVVVSMSTEYAGGLARRSVSRMNVDGREVRVSRDRDLDVAVTYLLSTGRAGSALDASDVFQLAHGVEGVRGPSVVDIAPDDLVTAEHRYYRTTVDETYRARDRISVDGVWNQRSPRWFDLGRRTTQRIHRVPGAATYQRLLRGEAWTAHRETRGEERGRQDVLSHPMLGQLDVTYGGPGLIDVTGIPFSDGSGTRFDPSGEHTLTATVDGEVVRDRRVHDGRESIENLSVEPGQPVTVRLEGNNSGGRLSRHTVTEVTLPAYVTPGGRRIAVGDRPPTVRDVTIERTNTDNAIGPGPERLSLRLDMVGAPVEPRVWFSTSSPTDPPWENRSGWVEADTERTVGGLLATMDVADGGETLSVAAEVSDIWDRRTRTMTTDAVHVGTAPNASTSTIVGRVVANDGTPAGNSTVVLHRVDGDEVEYVPTDRQGVFEVEVPKTRRYDLLYVRGSPWRPHTSVEDDRPAWHALGRVDAADDRDLGDLTLPPGRTLSVTVTDERGLPVDGATVAVVQRERNVTVRDVLLTDGRGRAAPSGVDVPGIALSGTANLTVTAPDAGPYQTQTHEYAVTLDRPRTVNVTLETTPPTARLAAFGKFEPGTVVFLHARRSEVPAGAAEYRWDLDGDSGVDRVTEEPIVRYVPPVGTSRPSVTVVDEAGKTDTSTLTLEIHE